MKARIVWYTVYASVAALTIASYVTAHTFIIAQEPWEEDIVISNFTLNYLMLLLLVGALGGYGAQKIAWRLTKNAALRLGLVVMCTAIVGALLLLLLKAAGVGIR